MKIIKKLNNKGFGNAEMLLSVVAVGAVIGIGLYVLQNSNTTTKAHAGGYTKIATLSTVWPNNLGTATETLSACVQPSVASGSIGNQVNNVTGGSSVNQVNVMAVANSVAQTSGLGVLIPTPSVNTPVAQYFGIQMISGTKVVSSNYVSILNPSLGGAGGGNVQTRGADLSSVQTFVLDPTAQYFRVFLYQHDAHTTGNPEVNANYYPYNVPGFNFKHDYGVNINKLSAC